ncbi:MAG: helix-turn-helix domain-containing protein [Woeseiaceae bacterium]
MHAIDEDFFYTSFGRIICSKRKFAGYTQGELAKELGVSRTTIANIEGGRQKTPLHMIYILGPLLGVQVHDLLPEPIGISIKSNIISSNEQIDLSQKSARVLEKILKKSLTR